MAKPLYLVDAFADGPFTGNPAGVCLLEELADEKWMQNVAMEMNQAETAFLVPAASGYDLRWFTPACEVDLCGHATLAAAHILWETGKLPADQIAGFNTKSGLLTCKKVNGKIEMDFPSEPATEKVAERTLFLGLNLMQPTDLLDPERRDKPPSHPDVLFVGANRMYAIVEVSSEGFLKSLRPNFPILKEVPVVGVMVTAKGESSDFVSRFFAPASGIPEDHATGSAHCCLGPYWAAKLGRNELSGFQASPRGARVGVRCEGERVALIGSAVTVMRGELM